MIRNQDQRSKDYTEIAQRYRPGHADYTYDQKYGIRDYRGEGAPLPVKQPHALPLKCCT